MNKKFIEKIEHKINNINILDKDLFVEESCKNIYRALLVVAENENTPINDIPDILNDVNKTIELLKKFDGINKEKYNGELSYIVIDVNNNQTLLYLIELLRQAIYYNDDANDKETATNDKGDKDININRINKILSSVFRTSQIVKIEKIDSIKFLPSKVGYTIEVKDNHDKFYYMIVDDELCYVAQVRENSIDGKIVYVPDDDYIPPTTNDFNELNNNSSISKIKNFFHIDSKINNNVTRFAQEHGYNGAKYIGKWKEYKVYEPYFEGNKVSYTGLPLVILVNNNGDIRMSTSDEAMATLDDKSFMESFEENNINDINNNSIDQSVISNVINNIDEKIEQLKSQENNNTTNVSNNTEIEINQHIQNNLDEVRKFSILNKSEEELFEAKKKFINDWYNLLINQVDSHWTMDSSTYRVHIQSIIEAILRRNEDDKSKKEFEYLKQAIECIQNENRVLLIKLVVDMKNTEEM